MPLPTNSHTLDPSQRVLSSAQRSPRPSSLLKRPYTPSLHDDVSGTHALHAATGSRVADDLEERRHHLISDLYERSERMIAAYFPRSDLEQKTTENTQQTLKLDHSSATQSGRTDRPSPDKRKARVLDENYDDDDEDEDEEESDREELNTKQVGKGAESSAILSQKKQRSSPLPVTAPNSRNTTPRTRFIPDSRTVASTTDHPKSSEDGLKALEAEKKAKEKAAKESFLHAFYTLEYDRDAMLEQERLDELDRQVETETSGQDSSAAQPSSSTVQGALSSANLGVNSLAFKHLIHHIDTNRSRVEADDSKLKTLFSQMRQNRGKFASEDRIGQEELYEAADRVLGELKSMTLQIAPFLQKVSKREAPDYHVLIKNPMDVGTMLKKMKQMQYKSKKEFVDDLDLIWTNCLKYNSDPNHGLRKKAEFMKKEADRLTPLIPDIVIRDRAEVEAEERRQHLNDFGADDDSDEEPIISSRGRKAPSKGGQKGTSNARKAPPAEETSPGLDSRSASVTATSGANVKNEQSKGDSDGVNDVAGVSGPGTPPAAGSMTPSVNYGVRNIVGVADDPSELEEIQSTMNGVGLGHFDTLEQEDEDFRNWKQVTKKERAGVASARHRMFKNDKLNPDEPALLRTKAGMRRWSRLQKALTGEDISQLGGIDSESRNLVEESQGATLAEGINGEDESVLPDYYSPLNAIPSINPRIAWQEDFQGYVTSNLAECLRKVPQGHFTIPDSHLSNQIDSNLRQIQDTRRSAAQIGVIKQMQVQAHAYQTQFQKYRPVPFVESDIEPTVVSDDGPVMAPHVSRAALQRSIAKLFYHAGFEDFQPAALDSATDIVATYFAKICRTFGILSQQPKIEDVSARKADETAPAQRLYRPRFTQEECILHTLHESGVSVADLDAYVLEDVERFGTKLENHHLKMAEWHRDLLRPALDPSLPGNDASEAFGENSQQFLSGDILAEDLDEDFFGFRELGLDKEFGIESLSVPLHLLQSRLHNAHQPANANASSSSGNLMEEPPRYPPITRDNLDQQIGLVKNFFLQKLEASTEGELVEDEDLPAKQRFPKPRLPPTGKISSPRKRPLREQQMMARKKRKMELEAEREREESEASGLINGAGNDSTLNDSTAVSDPSKPAESRLQTNGGSGNDATAAVEAQAEVIVNGMQANGEPSISDSNEATKDTLQEPSGKARLEAPDEDGEPKGDPQKTQDDEQSNGMKTTEGMPIAAH